MQLQEQKLRAVEKEEYDEAKRLKVKYKDKIIVFKK
jgi:hypothetical protein